MARAGAAEPGRRARSGTRRGRCSGCAGCRSRSWPTCWPRWTGNPPGGTGFTPRSPACPRRNGRNSVRCRFRWPTGGWCAGRAGCCCRDRGLSTPTGSPCSASAWSHPEAAHPLLARLGAVEATPRSVLEDPATRAAVKNSYDSAVEAAYDDDSPRRLADAVLGLLAALDVAPGEYPWLAELALPGEDGDWYPAGELLLPGAPLAASHRRGRAIRHGRRGPGGTARRGGAAGGRRAVVLRPPDRGRRRTRRSPGSTWTSTASTSGPPTPGDRLRPAGDGLPPLPPVAVEFTAVRDLDLVDRDRWPQALDLLTRPPLRAALTEPTRVRLPDGRQRRRPVLHGLVAAPPRDARRAAPVRPARCRTRTRCWPACTTRSPRQGRPTPTRRSPASSPTRRSPARSGSGLPSPPCSPSPAARMSCSAGSPTRPARLPGRNCGRCGRHSRPPTA